MKKPSPPIHTDTPALDAPWCATCEAMLTSRILYDESDCNPEEEALDA